MQQAIQDPSIRTVTAASCALALMTGAAGAQVPSDAERIAYGPHMMWWNGGWYGMVFGPLFMVLVLAVVIAIAVLLVRWLGGPYRETPVRNTPPVRTPLDILKERFARGEIDKDEFEDRRRILGE